MLSYITLLCYIIQPYLEFSWQRRFFLPLRAEFKFQCSPGFRLAMTMASSGFLPRLFPSARSFTLSLPLFANEPIWRLKTSLAEGFLWFPLLTARGLNNFPRTNMEEGKYLQYIPQACAMCNGLHDGALTPDPMWEMMIISMLNYQANEVLEAVVKKHMMDQLDAVRALLERLSDDCNSALNSDGATRPNGIYESPVSLNGNIPDMNYVEQVLRRFINYILTHPTVVRSPPSVQRTLRRELKVFILARLAHVQTSGYCVSTVKTTMEVSFDIGPRRTSTASTFPSSVERKRQLRV